MQRVETRFRIPQLLRACRTQVSDYVKKIVRAYKMSLWLVVWLIGFALTFPNLLPIPRVLLLASVGGLLIGISVNDLKTRVVPNYVTYPLMIAGIARAVAQGDASVLLFWLACFFLWAARFIGGGDAKLLMGLFGLFPDMELAWVIAASVLATGLPYLIYKYRGHWRSALKRLVWRLVTRQLLPSEEEFDGQAVPFAFSFCLAGGIYLLLQMARS